MGFLTCVLKSLHTDKMSSLLLKEYIDLIEIAHRYTKQHETMRCEKWHFTLYNIVKLLHFYNSLKLFAFKIISFFMHFYWFFSSKRGNLFGSSDESYRNQQSWNLWQMCSSSFFLLAIIALETLGLSYIKHAYFLTGRFTDERNSCAGLTMH